MGETLIAPPLPEDHPEDSFFSRIPKIFFSPQQAFESIVRRPDFLAPLITMTVAGYIIIEAMLQKIGVERIIRRSLELSGKAAQMGPEQVDRAVHGAATVTAVIMRVAGLLGVPIYLLVFAATGLFIVNVLFGASADFKKCFSVVCYANLVGIVGMVLALVMILLGDPEQVNPDNFVPTTVGFFLNPQEISKPLYVIASSFDVFRVWFVVLSSLGLSVATGKKVRTTAILLTYLGIWLVLVLVHAGYAALTG